MWITIKKTLQMPEKETKRSVMLKPIRFRSLLWKGHVFLSFLLFYVNFLVLIMRWDAWDWRSFLKTGCPPWRSRGITKIIPIIRTHMWEIRQDMHEKTTTKWEKCDMKRSEESNSQDDVTKLRKEWKMCRNCKLSAQNRRMEWFGKTLFAAVEGKRSMMKLWTWCVLLFCFHANTLDFLACCFSFHFPASGVCRSLIKHACIWFGLSSVDG